MQIQRLSVAKFGNTQNVANFRNDYFNSFQNRTIEQTKNTEVSKKSKFPLIATLVALSAVAAALVIYTTRGRKPNAKAQNATTEIATGFSTILTKGQDAELKNQYLNGLKKVFGITKKPEDLKSIMGPEEFKQLLKKTQPDDFLVHENAQPFMERIQIARTGEYYVPKSNSEYYKYLNTEMPKEELENYYRPLIDGKCRVFLTSELDYGYSTPQEAAQKFPDRFLFQPVSEQAPSTEILPYPPWQFVRRFCND